MEKEIDEREGIGNEKGEGNYFKDFIISGPFCRLTHQESSFILYLHLSIRPLFTGEWWGLRWREKKDRKKQVPRALSSHPYPSHQVLHFSMPFFPCHFLSIWGRTASEKDNHSSRIWRTREKRDREWSRLFSVLIHRPFLSQPLDHL